MKTVEWKGITLTVVPTKNRRCFITSNGSVLVKCHLRGGSTLGCTTICPDENDAGYQNQTGHILLESDDLTKYLAAKLMGGST